MPIFDWNVINLMLMVAGSPLTLLILQLAQIVQAQYNANSSSKTDAAHHVELMGALGAIERQGAQEMGIFQSIQRRLAMIVEQMRSGFVFVAPATSQRASVANTIDADDSAPSQSSGGVSPSRQLLAPSRETSELMTSLASDSINTSAIVGVTEVERQAKEQWQDAAVSSVRQRISSRERATIDNAIPNWPHFADLLRDAIGHDAILVLPRLRGAAPDDANTFYEALRDTIDTYNAQCDTNSRVSLDERGPRRLRRAQRMKLASSALAQYLLWTDETVSAVQRVLYMMPTICLQVDLGQPDGVSHLSAWYWATGDARPTPFSQWLRPMPAPYRQRDGAFAAAQLLLVLLADILSLGASEGVSIISDLLRQQAVSALSQERFQVWYRTMREAFSGNYGGVGIAGVPEVQEGKDSATLPTEVVDEDQAILLAKIRACVAPFEFNASTRGYADSQYLYLAMQDNEAERAHVYYLVIEQRVNQHVTIRALRETLGLGPVVMADIDQRLNVFAEQCKGIFDSAPIRFEWVADAEPQIVVNTLAASLRALDPNHSRARRHRF